MIETQIIKIDDISHSLGDLKRAGELLAVGKLVVIPTETVYGLGADALNPQAVAKIFEAKGRPQDNPLIVHIHEIGGLDKLCRDIPDAAYRLAERFWPGPLTMILKKKDIVPPIVSAGLDTVAVRMPSDPVARKIIEYSGTAIAAPSANLSGIPSPTCAEHVIRDMTGRVDMIVDAGECAIGVESTVVSLLGGIPVVLRPGAVTPDDLKSVIGEVKIDPAVFNQLEQGRKAASPGMKYKHYSPKAHVIMLEGDSSAYSKYVNAHAGEGVYALCYNEAEHLLQVPCLSYGDNSKEQARKLFACLRKLDDLGAKAVYAQAPRKDGVGIAVYNRLIRAAGFEVVEL